MSEPQCFCNSAGQGHYQVIGCNDGKDIDAFNRGDDVFESRVWLAEVDGDSAGNGGNQRVFAIGYDQQSIAEFLRSVYIAGDSITTRWGEE